MRRYQKEEVGRLRAEAIRLGRSTFMKPPLHWKKGEPSTIASTGTSRPALGIRTKAVSSKHTGGKAPRTAVLKPSVAREDEPVTKRRVKTVSRPEIKRKPELKRKPDTKRK